MLILKKLFSNSNKLALVVPFVISREFLNFFFAMCCAVVAPIRGRSFSRYVIGMSIDVCVNLGVLVFLDWSILNL